MKRGTETDDPREARLGRDQGEGAMQHGRQGPSPDGPLHIIFAASECVPFQKTGELAEVTASLPKELAALGHRVEIFIPLYLKALLFPVNAGIPIQRSEEFRPVKIRLDRFLFRSRIYTTSLPDAPVKVHLVDADTFQYFTSRSALGSPYGFSDNFSRFTFFSKVVATISARRRDRPDVVHAHDWPTGFVPMYLSTLFGWSRLATVFSIHNLGQTQGLPPELFYQVTRLRDVRHPGLYDWKGRGILHNGRMDMLKAGIVRADMVNTVSPSYAQEIQLPEHGGSYAGTLRWIANRGQLAGIVNGVDTMWHPPVAADQLVPHKQRCKQELQRVFSLPADRDTFLMAMTSRLLPHKGYGLIPETMDLLRQRGVRLQFLVVANGESGLAEELRGLDSPEMPVRLWSYNEELTRKLVYPGADVLLKPSLHEPCGLGQLIAQLNGTPPVVHAVGGMQDTVQDGVTGFVFRSFTPTDFADAVLRAYRMYRNERSAWYALLRRTAGLEYSWSHTARRYVELYRQAVERAQREDRLG